MLLQKSGVELLRVQTVDFLFVREGDKAVVVWLYRQQGQRAAVLDAGHRVQVCWQLVFAHWRGFQWGLGLESLEVKDRRAKLDHFR